jgi:hypothetical protein
MCIVSESAKLKTTKIFVGPNKKENRQIVVYSNSVENRHPNNFMILPVPDTKSLEFHDLRGYKNIFKDCETAFNSLLKGRGNQDGGIKVFSVGSYDVSVVENKNKIKDLNPKYFSVSKGLIQFLQKKYDNDRGFVVCKLKKGKHDYHPMAYSHKIIKNRLYIPTIHYHGPSKYADMSSTYRRSFEPQGLYGLFNNGINTSKTIPIVNDKDNEIDFDDEKTAEWEHEIYIANFYKFIGRSKIFNKFRPETIYWNKKDPINRKKLGFDLAPLNNFEKLEINKAAPNIDLKCRFSKN